MGRLTRLVKFIAKERRLSIPAEFLHHHALRRGETLVLVASGLKLFGFAPPMWQRYMDLEKVKELILPEADDSLFQILRSGVTLKLGSQDRLVLPRHFPFPLTVNARLRWDILNGVLVLQPDAPQAYERVPLQGDLLALVNPQVFDRERAEEDLIKTVSVRRINWQDRTFANRPATTDNPIFHSVRTLGVQEPLILREMGRGYQVIDGFRRLSAARELGLKTVPAVVFEWLDEDDCRQLRLLSGPSEPVEEGPVQRLQSTVEMHDNRIPIEDMELQTGRKKRTLQRYMRIAQDPDIKEAVETGKISIYKAEAILRAGVNVEEAIRGGWTVKRIEDEGRRIVRRRRSRSHGVPSHPTR